MRFRLLPALDRGISRGQLALNVSHDRRFVFVGNWLAEQVAPTFRRSGQGFSLSGAVHSAEGDLGGAFLESGGAVSLTAGDSLVLTYAPASLGTDPEQPWIAFMARGGIGSSRLRGPLPAPATPASFALHQNEPNPFDATTLIRFDLPRKAHVRIEVFDLFGRRVTELANGSFEAGFHSVAWHHGASGRRVSPGVYIYRLHAGEFAAQRKMVLVP